MVIGLIGSGSYFELVINITGSSNSVGVKVGGGGDCTAATHNIKKNGQNSPFTLQR